MKYWMLGLLAIALLACDEAAPVEAEPADVGADIDVPPVDMGADLFTADMSVAEGTLRVTPETLDFARVNVGEQSSHELTITNSGPGPASVVQFDGLAAPFSISRQPPLNIPVGANRTLIVTYAPEAEGRVEQTLSLITEGGEMVRATITGEAIRPTASLVNNTLDLGLVPMGEPAAGFIQIENTSEVAILNITGVAGLEAPFEIPQGQTPVAAAPGEVGRIFVQFQSDTAGEFEQRVSISTNAGPFMMTVKARVIAVGDIAVRGVEPAWAPTDTATTLIIHGGPFPVEPTQITVGDIELSDLARLDDGRVTGILPADAMAPTGAMDVRVELGGAFGVRAGGLIRTPPVAEGHTLDAAAVAEAVGPEGNPWTLATDEVPVGTQLVVAPDTVILGDGQTLTINGSLWTSMDAGRVVFSAAERAPGAWGGLNFTGAEASTLTNTIVEYAGTESAAIRTAQPTTFNAITVRQSDTDGIQIDSGGLLILLGGDFTDIVGDAITMREPDGGLFRLERTWIRRVRWPVLANPSHFGQRPLGQGNDWAETEEIGVGLVGDITQDTILGNQPEGVRYSMRDTITIHEGATLTLASAAPLVISDSIVISGRMTLPGGLALTAEEDGAVYVQDSGVLEVQEMSARIDVEREDEPWIGLRVDGGSIIGELQILNAGKNDEPAVELTGDFGTINGLSVQGSAAQAMRINGMGEVTDVRLSENAQGVLIAGGTGRIQGESADVPAVVFVEPALCGDWDVSELLDANGVVVETECL